MAKKVSKVVKQTSKAKSVKPVIKTSRREMPLGVKIISILYCIGSAFLILGGIVSLVSSQVIVDAIKTQMNVTVSTGLLMMIGGLFILLAVIGFFIGRGLWKGKNWARLTAGIIAIIAVLGAINSIILGSIPSIFGLVLHGVIAWYLLFSKQAKRAF